MEKPKNFWQLLALFLLGIIVGFAFAPMKNGVRVKVMNNGNTLKGDELDAIDYYDDFDDEDFEQEDMSF